MPNTTIQSPVSRWPRKGCLALSLILLPFMIACQKQTAPATVLPIPVTLSTCEVTQLAEPIALAGLISATAESRLSFKIGGIVDRIYVKEGMMVSKGQLLASLNMKEIDAEVEKAKYGLEKASRDLARVKNLYRDHVATLEQLQDVTTAFEVAQSGFTIAVFNQQYARITAPTSGRVLKRFAEENELVSSGMPILQLSNSTAGYVVKVGLSGKDMLRVRLGDEALVRIDGIEGRSFKGILSQLSGSATPGVGTFEAEIRLVEIPKNVFSGLVARVRLLPTSKQAYRLIPIESFIEGDKKTGFIFVPDSSRQYSKKVKIDFDFIFGGFLAVRDSPQLPIEVIGEGAAFLKESSAITIIQ